MRFAFSEEQELIRKSAGELASRLARISDCRDFAAGKEPFSAALWQGLAETGFTGALIPESHGGSALGMVEAGNVLEVLGGSLSSVPYLGTCVLAAEIIKELGSDAQRDEWLPGIASGGLTVSVLGLLQPATGATGSARGRWAPVLCAAGVDILLVRVEDGANQWFIVLPPDSAHLVVEPMVTMDRSRRFAAVHLNDCLIAKIQRLAAPLQPALVSRLQAMAAAGAAAEMLGVATRVLDMACAYATERQQFGRPIATFQAIKHMIADQAVALEGLRSAVWAALWTIDHKPAQAVVAAALAKATADEVATRLAVESIQILGGMGFTAEVDAHLYLKRVQLDRILWAPAHFHQEILARYLEDLA